MAAGKSVIRGFDPENKAQVAELHAPQDEINSPDAEQTIHPADPLFGKNGTVIRGTINGRGQQKNLAPLKRFEDIQIYVFSMVRDMKKIQVDGRLALLEDRKQRLEALKAANFSEDMITSELEEMDKKIEALNKFPIIGFKIICKAPFKNATEALSGKHIPKSANTFVELKEFGSVDEVKKLNEEVVSGGGILCRTYDKVKTEQDRIYYPKWNLA